jgi:membrane protein DedA with SNARE-associated domain
LRRWRFLLFSAIGGAAWAIDTCLLAYSVSTVFADLPVASIVISGVITSVLVGGVYWTDRTRRAGDAEAQHPLRSTLRGHRA